MSLAIFILSLIHWELLNAKFSADYLKCTELESSKLGQVIFRLFFVFLIQWLVKKSILPHSWGLQGRHQTRLVSMEHVSPHSSLILKLTTLIWAQAWQIQSDFRAYEFTTAPGKEAARISCTAKNLFFHIFSATLSIAQNLKGEFRRIRA